MGKDGIGWEGIQCPRLDLIGIVTQDSPRRSKSTAINIQNISIDSTRMCSAEATVSLDLIEVQFSLLVNVFREFSTNYNQQASTKVLALQ